MERQHDLHEHKRFSNPPSLTGIKSKFHDDEAFMKVSLNLLARFEALDLTAAESIESTLVSPDDQLAYYEALCAKLSQIRTVGGYPTGSMIQKLDQQFSTELRDLCSLNFSGGGVTQSVQAPMTPRNGRNQESLQAFFLNRRHNTQARRFFPDIEPTPNRPMKRNMIRNLDWHLATAMQQVVSLSLDAAPTEKRDIPCYNPPSPMHFRAE